MSDHGPVVTVSRVVDGDTIEVAPAVDGPAAENDPKRKFSRRPAVLLPRPSSRLSALTEDDRRPNASSSALAGKSTVTCSPRR